MFLGGTFGQVGIRVRTVGGGERWDDLIDLTSESGNLDTIGEVLSVQNQSRQAVAGQDYQQLDTLLQFEVWFLNVIHFKICVDLMMRFD